MSVRQVRVHGPGDVRVDEVPCPKPGPRDAVVRVAACGICGTDLSFIRLGGRRGPADAPLCLGHEIAGVVEWVGSDVFDELARLHGTAPFLYGPTPATNAFIEASGASSVIGQVLERGRSGGRPSVVALHHAPVPTSYLLVMMKQFSIHGSMESPRRFEDAIELLARRDPSRVVTHRVPLARFDEALGVLQGAADCGKVLVTMGEER